MYCQISASPHAASGLNFSRPWTRSNSHSASCARQVSELTGLPAVEPHAQMVACRLPPVEAEALQARLLERHSIEVVVRERHEDVLLRASFQVYNEESDVRNLVDALAVEL